jgi:putative PIN family toxin of toxin-antitoxin system
MSPPPLKVVLDTNLLVAAAYAPASASRRIVAACLRGELIAVVSPALRREYEHILPRAVRGRAGEEMLRRLLEGATVVEPAEVPPVVPDDPDDDKLLAAALAAGAAAVISNDGHLLGLDPFGGVRVVRPVDFVAGWLGG